MALARGYAMASHRLALVYFFKKNHVVKLKALLMSITTCFCQRGASN